MRPMNEKAPVSVGAGAGAEGTCEKLPPRFTATPDLVPALLEIRAAVAATLVMVDRIDAAGRRLLTLVGGAR